MSDLTFAAAIPLKVAEAKAIEQAVAGPESVEQKVSRVAASLTRDLARGGVMLGPEWVQRIQDAIGTTESSAIVAKVEQTVNRMGESLIVPWVVEPSHISFYAMQAENAGISLEQQLKTHLDFAYSQGWFGQTAPEPFKILLLPEQYRDLQEIFGKDIVTGDDVITLVRDSIEKAKVEKEQDILAEVLAEPEPVEVMTPSEEKRVSRFQAFLDKVKGAEEPL